jgi:hypothetical protein
LREMPAGVGSVVWHAHSICHANEGARKIMGRHVAFSRQDTHLPLAS